MDRVGETNINNQGLKMTILNYHSYTNIDIQFDDGYITYNKEYKSFKKGSIKNPNYQDCQIQNKVGETNYNKSNTLMKIIEYNRNDNIIVEFQDEHKYKTKTSYLHFKNGSIANPYDKTVYNRGYLGEGKYKSKVNNKKTLPYLYWIAMFNRCYNEDNLKKEPSYKECSIHKDWLCFQNFAKWFDENYYTVEDEEMNLDKDILYKGNKVYSHEYCVFVPKRINTLFTKREALRGKYPIGVTYNENKNKYLSRCNIKYKNEKSKCVNLGYHNTPEEAFNAYKTFKEKHIKEVAEEYKNLIPLKLYKALYDYKVLITD